MENARTRALVRGLRVGAGMLMAGSFGWALAAQAGEFASHNWRVSPLLVGLAGAWALLRGPLIALTWWRVVRAWGYALDWWRGMRVYFHSGLARYLPGQYWYVLSRAMMAERTGVPKGVTATSTLVETALVAGSAAGLALLGLAQAEALPGEARWTILAGGILSPALLLLLAASPWSARVWDRLARLARSRPLPSALGWRAGLEALAAAYANWVMYGGVAVLCLAGLSADPARYVGLAPVIAGSFCAGVLGAAAVLFVPQGLVVREGLFAYLLTTLLAVPLPEAVGAAVLTRLVATAAEGVWAAALAMLAPAAATES